MGRPIHMASVSIAGWVLAVMILLSLTGCGGEKAHRTGQQAFGSAPPPPLDVLEQATPSPSPSPSPSSPSLASSSSSSSGLSLAEQAHRDVEAILQARREGIASPSTTNSDAALQQAANMPRRVVIWEQPKSRPAAMTETKNTSIAQEVDRNIEPDANTSRELAARDSAENDDAPPVKQATLEPERLRQLMVDLSRELYATGAYSNSPLRELLAIASMSLVDPERRLDANAIPDLTEKERQLLAGLQTFFADLGRSLNDQAEPERAVLDALEKLRSTLVQEPVLRLPTAALCTRVGGFGDYTPFNRYSFLAHSDQKVILYLEIDDFTSQVNQRGEYVTELAQQLTIYSDRDGIPVWKEEWRSATDVSKNKRQDFFTVQVITLPKALSVGKYHLKVRVRDEQSEAETETSIPFEMVADPKLAAGIDPQK